MPSIKRRKKRSGWCSKKCLKSTNNIGKKKQRKKEAKGPTKDVWKVDTLAMRIKKKVDYSSFSVKPNKVKPWEKRESVSMYYWSKLIVHRKSPGIPSKLHRPPGEPTFIIVFISDAVWYSVREPLLRGFSTGSSSSGKSCTSLFSFPFWFIHLLQGRNHLGLSEVTQTR